jgi:hypothetical protein
MSWMSEVAGLSLLKQTLHAVPLGTTKTTVFWAFAAKEANVRMVNPPDS